MPPSRKEICGKKDNRRRYLKRKKKRQYRWLPIFLMFRFMLTHLLLKVKRAGDGRTVSYHRASDVRTLYDMEKYGITVEKDALKEYGDQLIGRIEELEQNIYEKAGKTFNINSPKQLGVILFEDLKMPFAKKTKNGLFNKMQIF